ncbi:MAG: hypothetical protein ACHBN1_03495 [Heteroscytonema crispum UTEX LB 1556]
MVGSWWLLVGGSPVAWVGKTPLRPLGRPQDRSRSPTKGAKLTGGNLSDCRRKRPNTHQPTTNNQPLTPNWAPPNY